MSFLDRLFGNRTDPTIGWEMYRFPIPDFDLTSKQFGTLRFGDPLVGAAFLGRPNRISWTQGDYCELLYASGGFQLDFDCDKFAYAAFFIGPDGFLPKHPALELSKPRLRDGKPDGIILTRDVDRAMLERLFGAADLADTDSRETILRFNRHGVAMEFEMDANTERLKRWNLYPI